MSDTRPDAPQEPRGILDHRAGSLARPMIEDLKNRERAVKGRVPPEIRDALKPRYAIAGAIGEGGMAVVYKAFDSVLKRNVAIKTLRPELADNISAERFELEISTAARLDHPHIVPLHDRGAAGAVLYYVMRLVDGESLRDRLEQRKQLDIPEAIAIVRHVATALDYAHSQRVVHRDIKPENILLDANGAYVTDFGIARIQEVVGVKRLTATGVAIGTAPYMSPEQVEAGPIDGRSDVYSLTCVLYELLAGEPPYTGRSARDVLNKHLAAAIPDLHVVRSTVTPRMQQVIATGLQKAAVDRFPSARQLIDSFEKAFRTSSEPAEQAAKRPRTLAVLPFANMSGDSSNDYFSDGIADELIGALIRAGSLRVVARTSSFHFKGQQRDIREIGAALGATHLLEGSVRIAGQRLRATAQLVDAASGHPLWSERFDRDLADVFAVQDEITNAIATRLQRELLMPVQGVAEPALEPEAPSRAPGDTLRQRLIEATGGDYEIVEEIGRGTRCVVYRARDVALQRDVAIKALLPEAAVTGSHRERLKREMGMAARLEHPNIASVYAIRDRSDVVFVVMRLVEGMALSDLMKQAQLPLQVAQLILRQAARALTYAHKHLLVHRDLRPTKIRIDKAGVFLMDFGFAVAWDHEHDTRVESRTPAYLSPEQLGGSAVTGAADQYALGAIAYELLTGRHPFEGKTLLDVVTGHMFNPVPDARQVNEFVPPAVALAVRRMMAKDPAQRFPSCDAAIEAMGIFNEDVARDQLNRALTGDLEASGGELVAMWLPTASPGRARPAAAASPIKFKRSPVRSETDWGAFFAALWARIVALFKTPEPDTVSPDVDDELDASGEFGRSRFARAFGEPGERVAGSLEKGDITFGPKPTAQGAYVAYDAFLRGRFLLNFESKPESIFEAITHLDSAIAANSAFAPAYAARASARTLLARAGALPADENRALANADVSLALSNDPGLAEAHVARALVSMFFDWERRTALDALDHAIETSPAYADAYLWKGFALNWFEGTPGPAIEMFHRAIDLDPLSLVTRVELAFAHLLKGDLDQALVDADAAVSSGLLLGTKPRGEHRDRRPESEGFAAAHYARAVVLTEMGRYDEALVEGREALRVGGRQTMHLAVVGRAHALRGDAESAQGIIAKIEERGREGVPVATALATVRAALNDVPGAIKALNHALVERDVNLIYAPFSPQFAPLRAEPTFKDLVALVRQN